MSYIILFVGITVAFWVGYFAGFYAGAKQSIHLFADYVGAYLLCKQMKDDKKAEEIMDHMVETLHILK